MLLLWLMSLRRLFFIICFCCSCCWYCYCRCWCSCCGCGSITSVTNKLNKFRPPNSSNEPTTFAFSSLYPSSMHLSHIKLCSFSRLKLARAVLSAEKTSPSTWRQLSTGTECTMVLVHRGRMYNEEKAKVVAAVWGTEFKINLFNSVPRYSCFSLGWFWRIGWIHPFHQIILVQFILFLKSA